MKTAVTFARREMRGGLKGFRVLVACLALGVAAIAAAGSMRAAVNKGLQQDARALLGGDLDLRQSYRAADASERQALERLGRVSEIVEMRATARAGENGRLVELKGVDFAYPLAGKLELSPPLPAQTVLERRDGIWGAAADYNLLAGLGVKLGDRVAVGETAFEIRAIIEREPDRVATALAFGPRLMVASAALPETGLIQPGSLVRHAARLALAPGVSEAQAKKAIPDTGWQVRDVSDAAPGLGQVLDNMAAFLTLVGLTALLVGGVGVANAVKAYLDGKVATIAVLKAVGAPSRTIFATYALLVGMLSALGIALGLAVGALIPWAAVSMAGDALPVAARVGLYPAPLAVAALIGALNAAVFTLWPLARAGAIPATALFRQSVAPSGFWPGRWAVVALALAGAALSAVAVLSSERKALAAGFVAASLAAMALFRGLAWVLAKAAAALSSRRAGLFAHPTLRLALSNLHRPGSAAISVVLSLGLGLTVLVALALIEGNLARQFGERLPAQAPSFYFIDIQPDQAERIEALVRSVEPSAQVEKAPMVRGRVVRINGVPAAEVPVAPEAQWALRGDRGLTMAARIPAGTKLVEGQWWSEDYDGPPLASMDAGVARGFGLKPGDSLTLNVLGRDVTVRVASLRQIDWSSLSMNFTFILSPNALRGAPHTWIATIHAPNATEAAVERVVTRAMLNVSAIRVKEALLAVRHLMSNANMAVRLAGLMTLAAGGLVLAGAVMAGRRRRVYEAVVLKVLGATRADLWRAWAVEFGVLGLATGMFAALAGSLAAWVVLVHVMRADWTFLPVTAAATVALCVGASLLAGFAGTWVALRAKAAPLLRAD